MSSHFSNRTLQIYVFFLTMQRSNKNIISSKVGIFLENYGYWRIKPQYLEKIIPEKLDFAFSGLYLCYRNKLKLNNKNLWTKHK